MTTLSRSRPLLQSADKIGRPCDAARTDARRLRVLVAGGINIDLIASIDGMPEDDGTGLVSNLLIAPGGHGANCAAAVAALGAEVNLLGAVGGDFYGSYLLDNLVACGVDVSSVTRSTGVTTGTVIIPSSPEYRCMMMYRGANDDGAALTQALDRLDFGSFDLLILFDPPMPVADVLLQKAGSSRCLTIWAPGGLLSAAPAFATKAMAASSIVLNLAEYRRAFGEAHRTQTGVDVILTKGDQGATLFDAGGAAFHEAPWPVEAEDSTGAGDFFTATYGILCALGWPKRDALAVGNFAGALAVQGPGARHGHIRLASLVDQYRQCLEARVREQDA